MENENLKLLLSINLKKFRKEHRLSQAELAERAELSEQTINSIESRRLWPSDKTLLKICGVFEIQVYQLFLPEFIPLAYQEQEYNQLKTAVEESVRNLVSKTLETVFQKN